MRVTVAIATWNRCEALRSTLEAFLRLDVPVGTDWQLLVVNNNCSDATDAVVRSFDNRLPLRLLHQPVPGKSRACNLAIAEARGEFLLWTDDDALVEPGWMSALLEGFNRFDADFVFGRSQPRWPGAKPTWYHERFAGYFALLDYGPDGFVVTDRSKSFYGLNYGGRLEAFRALGGLREDFGFRGKAGGVGEDTDLFERAFDRGMRIAYTPAALVHHMIPASRVQKPYHRRRHWAANEVYYQVLSEFYPDVPWLLGLPRFFYAKAAGDAAGYLRTSIQGDASGQFHYEMQLVRFARLCLESARHGFKRPAPARVVPEGGAR